MESCAHVFVHLVWSTHSRRPILIGALRQKTHSLIVHNAHKLHCPVVAIGGTEDHVHLAVCLHPSVAVARLAQAVKGATSFALRNVRSLPGERALVWQEGYGAFSFSERDRETVERYVLSQLDRHARSATIASWEPAERA